MLGKLIKHDMKSLSRFLIVMHIFLVIASILGRIFMTSRINFNSEELNQTLLLFSYIIFLLIFIGISFGTYTLIGIRFYKNLFSDEGYLTHTLPVTKCQHLLSKIICGSIWAMIDMLLILLSFYILVSTSSIQAILQEHQAELLKGFGFVDLSTLKNFILLMVVFALIGTISSVIMIYASVAFGQLFEGHRVLGAVVSYFAITTVTSLIMTIIMGLTGLWTDVLISTTDTTFNFYDYMIDIIYISIPPSLFIPLILLIPTYMIMKKRVNLQ